MDRGGTRPRLRVDATLAAAVDHVRLCYDYLDTGDLDGYVSLFEAAPPRAGSGVGPVVPEGLARLIRSGVGVSHDVAEVFGSDRRLAVTGRLTVGDEAYDFVDVFRISDRALLLDRRCFVSPGDWAQLPPE